ncbi:HNH endonuclease [Streptomyces cyaneofuscatus]|uniref:HNH endonuclease n=1 Tax=Streptomyces cyaneofuscatus TaxID=66883 RepID=UPI0037D5674A
MREGFSLPRMASRIAEYLDRSRSLGTRKLDSGPVSITAVDLVITKKSGQRCSNVTPHGLCLGMRQSFETRPISGFPDYLASDDGYVWSKPRPRVRGRWRQPLPSSSTGYVVIEISGETRLMHRLVWEAFRGPIPDGHQIDHINRVRHDNRLTNLQCLSVKDHAAKDRRGERCGAAKLTEKQVRGIRLRYANGEASQRKLGGEYGVSRETIRWIVTGKSWAWLD